jgi:hypothetical protein
MYKILLVCGDGNRQYYRDHLEIIKKYCHKTIDMDKVEFENLNISPNMLSLTDLHDYLALIPPDYDDTHFSEENLDIYCKHDIKQFNKTHNNYYDFIIYEHCALRYFTSVEYVKYYNMLKRDGFLIHFAGMFYYSDYSLVQQNILDMKTSHPPAGKQGIIEQKDQHLYEYLEECENKMDLSSIYNLLYLKRFETIFKRINKYIFQKEDDRVFDMRDICKNYINYIFNFDAKVQYGGPCDDAYEEYKKTVPSELVSDTLDDGAPICIASSKCVSEKDTPVGDISVSIVLDVSGVGIVPDGDTSGKDESAVKVSSADIIPGGSVPIIKDVSSADIVQGDDTPTRKGVSDDSIVLEGSRLPEKKTDGQDVSGSGIVRDNSAPPEKKTDGQDVSGDGIVPSGSTSPGQQGVKNNKYFSTQVSNNKKVAHASSNSDAIIESDELYLKKYLLYKQKYLNLKKKI